MELFIEVKRGTITSKDASIELNISYRHTKRLYKKYKMEGLWKLIPKKRKVEPWNKTKKEVRKKSDRLERES
jgi:transposase